MIATAVIAILGGAATYAALTYGGWALGLSAYLVTGTIIAEGAKWGVEKRDRKPIEASIWLTVLLFWPLITVGAILKGRK